MIALNTIQIQDILLLKHIFQHIVLNLVRIFVELPHKRTYCNVTKKSNIISVLIYDDNLKHNIRKILYKSG